MATIRKEITNGYELTFTSDNTNTNVQVYNMPKYLSCSKPTVITEYDDVKRIEVIHSDALNGAFKAGGLDADPYGEYVVIYTADEVATYRNSYCDLFIW